MSCEKDIHTLHAPLIHKGRDIQFQLGYNNSGDAASIRDLGSKPNLQFVLESYFSQMGLQKVNEKPIGNRNGINLEFETTEEFINDSLEVYLSGDKLNGTGDDKDFIETTDRKGFIIILDPSKAHMLNCAPLQDEALEVKYLKRITYNTKGGS